MYHPQIETMIRVADAGSFSKAADQMYITPVSVMNQMNALERRIGVTIFERTNQGVVLTDAGRALYQDAKQIIAASNTAIERARQVAGIDTAVIRVGTSILRPCRPLMELWTKADDGTLPFQFKIITFGDDPASMSAMLKSLGSSIDCFVGPCDSAAWAKSYSIYPLRKCKSCIAVSRKHRLANRDILYWSDLEGETLMLVKQGESPVLDRMRAEIESKHPTVRIMDIPNFYDMDVFNECERNGYLMEVPETWADIHPSIATIPVAWEYKLPFGLVSARKPSRSFSEFVHIIDKVLTE
ncbi:MAG: LysR family transcriptional regulator [Oscillospiraceae bacterium]|nr:LysR family transcriptional regulator [Oscillospiraceae bacterium]